jgi:hypothetical protein
MTPPLNKAVALKEVKNGDENKLRSKNPYKRFEEATEASRATSNSWETEHH